jgi:predicted DNA-binding transcriptional regulator YafY
MALGHPGELQQDGSYVVEHPVADVQWAVRHVLQYGPEAEVLEPAELREEIVRRLRPHAAPGGPAPRSP